jgi:hypothetical protein
MMKRDAVLDIQHELIRSASNSKVAMNAKWLESVHGFLAMILIANHQLNHQVGRHLQHQHLRVKDAVLVIRHEPGRTA